MTLVDLTITNARIVTSRYIVEAGIAIDEQRIATIAKEPHLPKADRSIDAQGMLVMPGLIDSHVHLRDPGYTHKEDFLTGTKAAANGGVTLVMDEPNTNPTTVSLEAFKEKRGLGEAKAVTDFALSVGLNHENIAEIPRFSEAGAISYSIFTTASGDLGVVDDYVAFEALKAVGSVNGTAAVSPMLGDISSRVISDLMESER
ncbi:MAG: amidohydrolase family protein, partial [Nitrososphaeria archaeon]|nr:amidohydrolase family protein [Nitrososphaeria archaeon]NIN51656.1 amidohydrolase family protein [Nitrososphaeria archaeon]NIQ32140.1 amidohydrolase family protein [Nitrososphaeria archaeon]